MAKTLALFFDGTWNTPEELIEPTFWLRAKTLIKSLVASGSGPKATTTTDVTNVLKLMRAVFPSESCVAQACRACKRPGTRAIYPREQVSLYFSGVGTDPSPVSRWVEGAFGYGIDRDIQQAYQFIAQNFMSGDNLYLFGFSRGAFTARSLAGFLDVFGFIAPHQMYRLPEVYKMYENAADEIGLKAAKEFVKELARNIRWKGKEAIRIWFLGVWDTVGALWRLHPKLRRFHQTELPSNVHHAYQALALHEVREDFAPVLWTKIEPWQKVQQVWFPGSHSDVGGGYDPGHSGLSDIALKWMACRAMEASLALDIDYLKAFRPNPTAPLNDEHKGSLTKWGYPTPRKILRGDFTNARDFWSTIGIHQSAVVRPAPSGYRDVDLSRALDRAHMNGRRLVGDLGLPGIVAESCVW